MRFVAPFISGDRPWHRKPLFGNTKSQRAYRPANRSAGEIAAPCARSFTNRVVTLKRGWGRGSGEMATLPPFMILTVALEADVRNHDYCYGTPGTGPS
ncbi:unnamed protein product, partial [Iphiclides podalirius]